MSNLDYILEEYFATDGYYLRRPNAEEGHTKACLASSAIAAIENMRDDSGVTDFDFHVFLRDHLLGTVNDYLNESQISDCKCPPKVVEDQHYWTIHYKSILDGKWKLDQQFGNLTDVALEAAEYIALDIASRAYVAFADFGDGNAQPAMWVSIGWKRAV